MLNRSLVPVRSGSVCGILLAAGLCAPALAQEGNFTPRFAQGQTVAYDLSMRLNVSQRRVVTEGESPANNESMNCDARLELTVQKVGPDGSLELTGKVTSASIAIERGLASRSFAWPLAGEIAADAPAEKKLGEPLSASVITLNVDAKGVVTVSGGLDGFAQAVSKLDPPEPRLAGFFATTSFATMVEPIFRVDRARDVTREVGKVWQVTTGVELPPAGVAEFTTDFVFTAAQPEALAYGGPTTVSLMVPETRGEGVPAVRVTEGTGGAVAASFDPKAGLLRERRATSTINTLWTLGDLSLEQKQASAVGLTLVAQP